MSTLMLDTVDLVEAEDVLSANYTRMRFTTSSSTPARTRVARSRLGWLAFDDIRYGYDFSYDMGPPGAIVLCRVRSGCVEQDRDGGPPEVAGPGEMTAIAAGTQHTPLAGSVRHAVVTCVALGTEVLGTVASAAGRRGENRVVTLTAGTPVSPAANAHLVRAIDHVVDDVLSNPDVADSSLVARSVESYLASAMLVAFPSTAAVEQTALDRRDTTPLLLRRAMAFIDDNAHRAITVTEIAAAVHVTPRARQLMFRAHRDCTPRDHLRRVRLDHAHRELVASSPDHTTVTAVAARWGFAHAGRFAGYYRDEFGVMPQQSLRTAS